MCIGLGIPTLFVLLYVLGKAGRREMIFLVIGIGIGLSFEFYIWSRGPGFFYVILKWPLPWYTYYISHSLWDGGLFMGGYYLSAALLKKAPVHICRIFDWRELAIMTAWGAVTAFFVELIGNGQIWQYVPHTGNPVWIGIGGQGYTLFIQAIWLVVPAVFYFVCLAVSRMIFR
jgi:hypothetical protein